jgi:hypothetical protein
MDKGPSPTLLATQIQHTQTQLHTLQNIKQTLSFSSLVVVYVVFVVFETLSCSVTQTYFVAHAALKLATLQPQPPHC